MENELKKRWGDTEAYKYFTEKFGSGDEPETQKHVKVLIDLVAEAGKHKAASPESPEAKECVRAICTYVSENLVNCSPEMIRFFGRIYIRDERFREVIDDVGGEGTTEFLTAVLDKGF